MFLLVAVTAQAQTDRQCIRQGNRLYHQKQWAQAEVEYRKALSKNAENPQALYNLGCALMMQQKDSAAIIQYQKAAQVETNKLRRSKANHNIGVICQNHRMYGEAIKAYQQSLRDNPSDDETRYNLALCKQQNKNQQQNQQNQDKNKDKNQDKQKQDQKQNENKDKNKEQQQQEQKDQMSKDNAEQLLNAAIQNEKATQQRMKKAMQQPQRRNVQKNW
jgi:Ca-activated chloride channel family protein